MERKRVLITGAAGFIGGFLRQAFADRYVVRLTDIAQIDDPRGHEVMQADIRDLDQMRRACEGMEVVVHLAADPAPNADFCDSLLPLNIVGTYNVFSAAKEQGCQRVVFASSIHAVLGYPREISARSDMPVNPPNFYGVTKCFGEALGRCFAHQGLSSLAIRIGAIRRQEDVDRHRKDSQRDLVQLFQRCIDVEGVDFAIVHGQSGQHKPQLDISHTRAVVGYKPQDG